jgi:hypothetical protein
MTILPFMRIRQTLLSLSFPQYFMTYSESKNPQKLTFFSQKVYENLFSGQISLPKGKFYSLLLPDFTVEHVFFYYEKK